MEGADGTLKEGLRLRAERVSHAPGKILSPAPADDGNRHGGASGPFRFLSGRKEKRRGSGHGLQNLTGAVLP